MPNKKEYRLAAAQRLAISRVRLNEANMLDREGLDMPPSGKMGQTEHVGCMAVLGRWHRL